LVLVLGWVRTERATGIGVVCVCVCVRQAARSVFCQSVECCYPLWAEDGATTFCLTQSASLVFFSPFLPPSLSLSLSLCLSLSPFLSLYLCLALSDRKSTR